MAVRSANEGTPPPPNRAAWQRTLPTDRLSARQRRCSATQQLTGQEAWTWTAMARLGAIIRARHHRHGRRDDPQGRRARAGATASCCARACATTRPWRGGRERRLFATWAENRDRLGRCPPSERGSEPWAAPASSTCFRRIHVLHRGPPRRRGRLHRHDADRHRRRSPRCSQRR